MIRCNFRTRQPLEEICTDLLAVEKEAKGLLTEIVGGNR